MNVIERLLLLCNVKTEKVEAEADNTARSRSPRGNNSSRSACPETGIETESKRSRSPRRRPEGKLTNQTFSVRVQCSRLASKIVDIPSIISWSDWLQETSKKQQKHQRLHHPHLLKQRQLRLLLYQLQLNVRLHVVAKKKVSKKMIQFKHLCQNWLLSTNASVHGFSFSQERFHRVPFNAKEVIEEDTKNFWAWLESDLNTTAKQEEVIKKAFEHPLWKEYCLDCIENGAEDKVYYGGGISDIEDVSAEVEAWQSFLEQKGLKTQAPEEETTTGPTPSPVSVPTAAADATCWWKFAFSTHFFCSFAKLEKTQLLGEPGPRLSRIHRRAKQFILND